MQEGQATISPNILARYAGDAAREVDGVHALAGRRGVKVDDGSVEVHLVVEWGASIPAVGTAVRDRIRSYLAGMARVDDVEVTVVVDEVTAP
jgi:uncharacterized alkaline shock family protein YloU